MDSVASLASSGSGIERVISSMDFWISATDGCRLCSGIKAWDFGSANLSDFGEITC